MSVKKEISDSNKKNLIIVESPTKAKTISRFLEKNFLIESCQGHVRDLPKGKMGINPEKKFEAQYVIPTKKRKIVNKLKKLSTQVKKIYFATDEDREGEAIAWHLSQVLQPENSKHQSTNQQTNNKPISNFYRITFGEITEEAVKRALLNPREIDKNLVNAQQARRILDRLVGYHLSPLLWKKVVKGLSAGRVQSPAVRLIMEREEEIKKFKPEEYWSIEIKLEKEKNSFWAKLTKKDDQTLEKPGIKNKEQVEKIIKELKDAEYQVSKINEKQLTKHPLPPFTTSTLQQEANKKLGFTVKQTMMFAQQLYEGIALNKKSITGLITYMRTDSLHLADKFLNESQLFIENEYGKKYYQKRFYKTKIKNAQEAHEAIRPTDCRYAPKEIAKYLNKNQFKLYDLIWRRALASQMSSEIIDSISVDIKAKQYLFRANGSSINFDGWIKIYPEKQNECYLPKLKVDQILKLKQLKPEQHFTEPPPRYNEASLVKTLEEYGIGRPSTYAPIISTIQNRNYVQKQQKAFYPTEIGVLVNNLLVKHFPVIVDYQFTAEMENKLDEVAAGKDDHLKMLINFYQPFIKNLKMKEQEINKTFTDEQTDKRCPKCNEPLVIKMGRFGKFLACTGFPKCKYTQSLNQNNSNNETINVPCPKCNGEIVKKRTRKGKFFYGCSNWPKCDFALWDEPLNEKCPRCNSLMVRKGKNIICSNKMCK
ncbi:MAG: type I DNA topoisomerase [Patescibacteria group bacterium]|jgi:DNA topoisomerase-1|nr:type I DNA topoisomerase [Patescibacteria group bacterium]